MKVRVRLTWVVVEKVRVINGEEGEGAEGGVGEEGEGDHGDEKVRVMRVRVRLMMVMVKKVRVMRVRIMMRVMEVRVCVGIERAMVEEVSGEYEGALCVLESVWFLCDCLPTATSSRFLSLSFSFFSYHTLLVRKGKHP